MEEHGLKQTDLKEIGTQGVISEILSGKRKLNLRQIVQLSKRFSVSPTVLIGALIKLVYTKVAQASCLCL
jgi:HTH-type transcriptional regulator/antitoxin HigA